MKTELRDFGGSCAKCRASTTTIRTYCTGCKSVRGQDHMHSACTTCGYAWIERPADAPKARKGGRR